MQEITDLLLSLLNGEGLTMLLLLIESKTLEGPHVLMSLFIRIVTDSGRQIYTPKGILYILSKNRIVPLH